MKEYNWEEEVKRKAAAVRRTRKYQKKRNAMGLCSICKNKKEGEYNLCLDHLIKNRAYAKEYHKFLKSHGITWRTKNK